MDIQIKKQNDLNVVLSESGISDIYVGSPKTIMASMPHTTLEVALESRRGVDFSFISNIVSYGTVIRVTQTEFDALLNTSAIDEHAWYFVTNSSGQLRKIYAGSVLFAKRNTGGSMGFPYTFPMTF